MSNFAFYLYRSNFANDPFLPAGPGIPEAFDWVDHETMPFASELGYLNFNQAFGQDRSFMVGNEFHYEGSFVDAVGFLRISSAHAYEAPVPEPATVALSALGVALLIIRRFHGRVSG